MASSERTPSDVDRIAEGWVDTLVELNPAVGTYIGRPSADDRLADYSPDGHERTIDAIRTTRAGAARRRAGRRHRPHHGRRPRQRARARARGRTRPRLHLRDLNVIASPAQEIREVFDLMPTDSRDDWERIATRLGDVPRAIDGYIATLRAGAAEGVVPAVRQVREVAAQAHRIATPDGFFGTFAGNGEGRRRRAGRAAATRARARGRRRGIRLRHARRVPRGRAPAGRGRARRRRPRHLRAAVAALPRRRHRPRRDLRVGHRGARAHGRRAGVDRATRSCRGHPSPRRSRSSTATRAASCTAPTRCSGGCRRRATGRWPSSARPSSTSPPRSARSSA